MMFVAGWWWSVENNSVMNLLKTYVQLREYFDKYFDDNLYVGYKPQQNRSSGVKIFGV